LGIPPQLALERYNGRTAALWIANMIAALAFGAGHLRLFSNDKRFYHFRNESFLVSQGLPAKRYHRALLVSVMKDGWSRYGCPLLGGYRLSCDLGIGVNALPYL
jgi:hypothetical protein